MQSYHGAQIFEALGIHSEVMDRAFTGTPSRISGITFDTVIGDLVKYHDIAFPKNPEQTGCLPKYGIESRFSTARIGSLLDDDDKFSLPNLGDFHYRDGGELHYNAPEQMAMLQEAARKNSREAYGTYKKISHELVKGITLRGQLKFKESTPDDDSLFVLSETKEVKVSIASKETFTSETAPSGWIPLQTDYVSQ
jgi:glutamate synthase (NADPH/NADH)